MEVTAWASSTSSLKAPLSRCLQLSHGGLQQSGQRLSCRLPVPIAGEGVGAVRLHQRHLALRTRERAHVRVAAAIGVKWHFLPGRKGLTNARKTLSP